MPISSYFSKLSKGVQNRIFAALIAVIFTAGYNTFDKYLLRSENARIQLALADKSIELEQIKAANTELQIELVKCQAEYNNTQSSLDDMPLVCWKRNVRTGLISYLNDAFEKEVLQPLGKDRFDLLYKADSLVFGSTYSKTYLESFNYVVSTGKSITRVEQSIQNGKVIQWKTTKYPIYRNGELQSVGGISSKLE
jgi:hypothetical protein